MDGIHINVNDKKVNGKKEYGFQILTSAIFVFGWIWLYLSAFSFWEKDWITLALFGIIISTVFVFLNNSRGGVYIFSGGCLLGIIIFLLGFNYGKNGILQHINEFLKIGRASCRERV